MTKQQLKKTAQNLFNVFEGFEPKLKDIILLEAGTKYGEVDYLMFAVGNHEYQYHYGYPLEQVK